jgi:hypothetical protein
VGRNGHFLGNAGVPAVDAIYVKHLSVYPSYTKNSVQDDRRYIRLSENFGPYDRTTWK